MNIRQPIQKIKAYIETNITSPAIRRVIYANAMLLLFIFFLALSTSMETDFFIWIFFGGILAFWNFFFLALFIQKYFNSKMLGTKIDKILPFGQILISNLRLFLTGILLYISLVHWNANPIGLLVGVSIPVITIPILLICNVKNPFNKNTQQ